MSHASIIWIALFQLDSLKGGMTFCYMVNGGHGAKERLQTTAVPVVKGIHTPKTQMHPFNGQFLVTWFGRTSLILRVLMQNFARCMSFLTPIKGITYQTLSCLHSLNDSRAITLV